MTLSIELLPAPFGPMMARTSCSRTSKRDVGQRLDAAEAQRDAVEFEDRRSERKGAPGPTAPDRGTDWVIMPRQAAPGWRLKAVATRVFGSADAAASSAAALERAPRPAASASSSGW